MPRNRPAASGYARIAQADHDEAGLDDSEDEDPFRRPRTISTASVPQNTVYAPASDGMYADTPEIGPQGERRRSGAYGRRRPRRSSSGVDIKAINARFERWAEEIAAKFKIHKVHGKSAAEERLEIKHSVFQAPEGVRPVSATGDQYLSSSSASDRMDKMGFDDVVESVRVAIELGMHPKMISQGSSGSYFARNSSGKVVGVFKPKDEEPYASRNPKWTKWIHRNLFPCFFGRACLIPNLSYVSEAAAYVLDTRLQTNLVPYTDIVHLSSKSFHYDFWDKSAYYRTRKPLPSKVGSFQVFLQGFKDANIFLRDNPWPDQPVSAYSATESSRWRRRPWQQNSRRSGANPDQPQPDPNAQDSPTGRFFWTEAIQESFRHELEKLVILDYIMRNTDRGLDNWMVRIDEQNQSVTIVAEAPTGNGSTEHRPAPVRKDTQYQPRRPSRSPYRRQEAMAASRNVSDTFQNPCISIGAIDNSLSWPWKHPDAWRSFPFGWLFLPVSLIGQPFSQKTRDHFLPLLTSAHWWSETQTALRQVFAQDSDFKEKMFARQIAVMKGQAWNVLETLKTPDHGPLELTRRTRVCVWDDLVDIPVAIPMQRPSVEMRRKTEELLRHSLEAEEEMDIGAANAHKQQQRQEKDRKYQEQQQALEERKQIDLLGSPSSNLPNPNRFDLSRRNSSADAEDASQRRGSAEYAPDRSRDQRPRHQRHSSQQAMGLRPGGETTTPTRRRANQHRRRISGSLRYANPFYSDTDDLEADIGYSAAEDMEGSRRKVIVERLETVQSKNPVFTWC